MLWQIGSIGKSVTAVVALQLVEEGRLALEVPVADYLPWFTVGGDDDTITLHHLLRHTSGLIGTSDLAPASSYDVIASPIPRSVSPLVSTGCTPTSATAWWGACSSP